MGSDTTAEQNGNQRPIVRDLENLPVGVVFDDMNTKKCTSRVMMWYLNLE